MEDLAGVKPKLACEPLETAPRGLGRADLARVQGHLEGLPQADAAEVGVPVAERRERESGTQPLEAGHHVGEQLYLVAGRQEHCECLCGEAGVVAVLARVRLQSGEPQVSQVVGAGRLALRELLASAPHVLEREALHDPRAVLPEPRRERGLRARQHRLDIPECIIEIESDGAHGTQHRPVGYHRMASLTLVIGNRNYSSWSLRAWLLLKHLGLEFEEIVIPLDRPETREQIERQSPSGRLPLLRDGELQIWDSLAICEYAAELTGQGWPRARAARAVARAVSAEVHSGFTTLRSLWPMNARARNRHTAITVALEEDIERIDALWNDCRGRFGSGGPWLFGEYSVADAMYAPVVLRFNTYGARISQAARWYMATVLEDAQLQEWLAAAKQEPWIIAADEVG